MHPIRPWVLAGFAALTLIACGVRNAVAAERHRVIVSTDIGGTDPDDYQSMIHLLLCADSLDLEGLISSPFTQGSKQDIRRVIDLYEHDYPHLKAASARYPTPAALRAITRQGALKNRGGAGFAEATEGSNAIVAAARHEDALRRPLYVLVWGSLSDLAQALHDAPDIEEKICVYFIGGPNKMWNPDSYEYLYEHHPKLHFIESNFTYAGQFLGGDQSGEWGNKSFVAKHIAPYGALGEFFASLREGELKMGDTPSVGWLLHGDPTAPSKESWGGQFVRIWDGRKTKFDRPTTTADPVEACGIVEFALPAPAGMTPDIHVKVLLDGRVPAAVTTDGGVIRFRVSPKSAKVWSYDIHSDLPALEKFSGEFTAIPASAERSHKPSTSHPSWWIDDPDPALAEGPNLGAKTVNRWRHDFLGDFATRMERATK